MSLPPLIFEPRLKPEGAAEMVRQWEAEQAKRREPTDAQLYDRLFRKAARGGLDPAAAHRYAARWLRFLRSDQARKEGVA